MTSSCVDPTTVRFDFCHRCWSTTNQQSPFIDHSFCCDPQNNHEQDVQHVSQPSLAESNTQIPWSNQESQNKPWIIWSNNAWQSQASPGAHGDEHTTLAWENILPQAYMSSSVSDGNDMHAGQSNTGNWLLQRSYHGAPVMSGHQSTWNYDQVQPEYNHAHQNHDYTHYHGRHSYDGSTDMQYIDACDARSENNPIVAPYYATHTPDETVVRKNNYAEENKSSPWHLPQSPHNAGFNNISSQAINAADTVRPGFERSKASYLSEMTVSTLETGTRRSLYSPSCDVDDNASCVTSTTSPTDLIPYPPSELLDPPTEDMNPDDQTMIPQRRNLKDPNHLYMPRWTRGNGKQREGWCGACRPGKWLSLKRSTYWYHKNFCHGITVMGTLFPRPTRTRPLADDKGWEGYCGSCSKWIMLNGGKKSHTSWFRHAYKCDPSAAARGSPPRSFLYRSH